MVDVLVVAGGDRPGDDQRAGDRYLQRREPVAGLHGVTLGQTVAGLHGVTTWKTGTGLHGVTTWKTGIGLHGVTPWKTGSTSSSS